MAEWKAIRREFYADRDVLDAIENRADATSEFRQGPVTAGRSECLVVPVGLR
jgi:hypothetical protein